MSFIKSYKTSLGAFLLIFMVNDYCSMELEPPSTLEEPIIYVSFRRWENRTFSPRIYYLLLQRYGLKNQLLNLPPNGVEVRGGNNAVEPLVNVDVSSRFGFSGSKGKLERPGTTPNKLDGFVDTIHEEKKVYEAGRNGSTVHFPSTNPSVSTDDFFFDRLAYPGLSNRRPTQETRLKQQTSVEFSRIKSLPRLTTAPTLTDDDTIETIGLTFDIMRASDWQDENVVFSPLSISNVLAILLLGADGITYKEIAAQLRRHSSPLHTMDREKELRFHTAFRNLLNILDTNIGDQTSLETFSHIFVDEKFPLVKSFEENSIEFYNCQSKTFNFQTDGEIFKEKVNAWIKYKTRGKIPLLVDTPPDSTTTFSLVNAVYFQGNWKSPFIPGITQSKPFYVSSSEIMDVPMMTNILTIPYLEDENFRVIGLPYKDNKTGLFIILPKQEGIKGLRDLEQQITPEIFKRIFSMRLTQVTVQMPKMRVESDGHIQEILIKLGMKTIFDQKYANFSRISDANGLYIKSILHRAIMDVNERGTEAAAATIATGDRNLDERPVLFAVNRPFIFSIIQIKAKTILFWGRVTRPQPLPK